MSRKWIWWRLTHILIDLLGLWGCFLFAYFVRVDWVFSTDFNFEPFVPMALGASLVWTLFLLLSRFYRIVPDYRLTERCLQIAKILIGGAAAVAALIVLYFFKQELFFSRLINGYAFVFGTTWLVFSSMAYDFILRWDKRTNKQAVYRTVIVGANRVSEKLIEKFEQDPFAPYQIIGVIDPYGLASENFRGKVLGKLNKLESVCEQESVTALIQCDAFEHTINLISFAKENDLKFLFDPALRGVLEENLRIRRNAGQTMIQFVDRDFSGRKKRWYRFVDWVLVNIFDTD